MLKAMYLAILLDIYRLLPAFLLFAVPHSLFAVEPLKTRLLSLMQSRAPFYRVLYNFLAFLTVLPFLIMVASYSDLVVAIRFPYSFLLKTLQYLSLLGILMAAKDFLGELSGVKQIFEYFEIKKAGTAGTLRTDGLFAVTRHPIYLFSLIYLWLDPVMTTRYLAGIILVSLYVCLGTYHEEYRLRREFSGYAEYSLETSRIIPFKWLKRKFIDSFWTANRAPLK